MKSFIVSAVALTLMVNSAVSQLAEADEPEYVGESPLPEGWPSPGPYNKVAEKVYPTYRAAFATGKQQNRAFWTLFEHISSKDIPMTAPVEMEMNSGGEKLSMASMAFLYQNTKVGKVGSDGEQVEVKDIPKTKAFSYAFQGGRTDDAVAKARTALENALKEKGLKATSFRLLGYNGPGTPDAKKTWELQALLQNGEHRHQCPAPSS